MKRVVIVGAGPCGLAALKEILEAGHDPMLFERSDKLGGVFASAAIYPNLHLTISNWAMAFSDFPDPTRLQYSSAEEYLRYLQSYACHFSLERHIRYHSEVCNANLRADGQWELQVQESRMDSTARTIIDVQCDALIVATASNQLPKPLPPGLSGFNGRVLYSNEYDSSFKQSVATKKLKVLVVGGGESGADISAELGSLSPGAVTVWLRRPPCTGPRYLNSRSEVQQMEANKTTDFPANGFLEAATTSRMSVALNVYAYGFFRRVLWSLPILNATLSRLSLAHTAPAWGRNDQASYVTKNQRMCEALHDKQIELLVSPSATARGNGGECEFQMPDGTTQHRFFDAIVLCTGFHFAFPWLHLPSSSFSPNPRSWYLHCIPPDLPSQNLFFVGFARPHQGGIPAVAEMLSRYIALLLSGERSLPLDYAARARRDAIAETQYYFLSPKLDTLVDYNGLMESVARKIGCEPRLPLSCIALFNAHLLAALGMGLGLVRVWFWGADFLHSRWFVTLLLLWAGSAMACLVLKRGLLFKWWFYPQWSVWYRQRGPGAKPALLEAVLRRVDVWKATSVTSGFVLLLAWSLPAYYAQRLLSVVVFVIHALFVKFRGRSSDSDDLGGLLRPKIFALHDCLWRIEDLFLP